MVAVRAGNLGWVLSSSTGYRCFPGRPNTLRYPDLSFVRLARLAPHQVTRANLRIAPDLAVEVISPSDTFYEVNGKIGEYLSAGVPLQWVVDPETRTVFVVQPSGIVRLGPDDILDGSAIVPGFSHRVSEFLPERPPTPPSEATNETETPTADE